MTAADPNRLVAALARDAINLDLKTVDLCFLAALYLRADRAALASFEEAQLVDLFEQVLEVVEAGADSPRKRATHSIQRLREQRMLARVDGAGLVKAGEYTLTRLAAAVVDYFLADEALTRESLTLLTGTLRAQLAEILSAAKAPADDGESWRQRVIAPLRVTVADLIQGIERRQRGLDAQQEAVQTEIAALLQADWFGAVDRCQALLDTTTTTLKELNEVLLRDTHHFVALLQDIQTTAAVAGNAEAEQVAQRVIEQVDRIAAWGEGRQRSWSGYYQYVHRYLRDVVRLDPDRALSQRLRDQISGWPQAQFFTAVATAAPIRLLRPLEARVDRPVVMRPRAEREVELSFVVPSDLFADLEQRIQAAVAGGATDLATITAHVLADLPLHTHYPAAGRVAEVVARTLPLSTARERPWRAVGAALEIEDWTLAHREGPP
jgi:chromosome partition protein MukF